MDVKIDKEQLIKHHFWILTGTFFLFTLIPLSCLGMRVSGMVDQATLEVNAAENKIKSLKEPRNPKWVTAYKKQDEFVDKKKQEVWQQAWETQKDLMTFPEAMTSVFTPLYFGDELDTHPEEAAFKREHFKQEYPKQLVHLSDIVQPVDWKGEGVVQIP
jgi:hypothetical protein